MAPAVAQNCPWQSWGAGSKVHLPGNILSLLPAVPPLTTAIATTPELAHFERWLCDRHPPECFYASINVILPPSFQQLYGVEGGPILIPIL